MKTCRLQSSKTHALKTHLISACMNIIKLKTSAITDFLKTKPCSSYSPNSSGKTQTLKESIATSHCDCQDYICENYLRLALFPYN